MLAEPDRPLARTPKGTLSRAATLQAYARDINAMYAALERHEYAKTTLGTLESPSTKIAIEAWLKSWLENILGTTVYVGIDLFQQGLDRYAFMIEFFDHWWY